MRTAIDDHNVQLENDGEDILGQENVKKIANMFTLIGMRDEGMKFYTNFIMVGTLQKNQTAASTSTSK